MTLRTALWLMLAVSHAVVGALPSVAILPFENATAHSSLDALTESLPDLFAACLADYADRVSVVERNELTRAFDDRHNSTVEILRGDRFGQEFGHPNISRVQHVVAQ